MPKGIISRRLNSRLSMPILLWGKRQVDLIFYGARQAAPVKIQIRHCKTGASARPQLA